MTDVKEVPLQIFITDTLKYRLDRATLEERTTLKEKVTKILEQNLPEYPEIEEIKTRFTDETYYKRNYKKE